MERYRVRPGAPGDFGRMADLMAESIRRLGPEHYAQDQVEVWAAAAHDQGRFARLVHGAFTLVVEDGESLAGFGAIHDDGHLTALYVHPEHGRRGIASTILAFLLNHARAHSIDRVHTEASEFSHPVFAQAGFRVEATETVERNGVRVQRRRMSLSLSTAP